jgi:hypothetical protein
MPTGPLVSVASPNATPAAAAAAVFPDSSHRAAARKPKVRKNVSIMSVTAERASKAYSSEVASTTAPSRCVPRTRHPRGAQTARAIAPSVPVSAEARRADHSVTPNVLNAASTAQ